MEEEIKSCRYNNYQHCPYNNKVPFCHLCPFNPEEAHEVIGNIDISNPWNDSGNNLGEGF